MLKNLSLPFKMLKSLYKARKIIKDFDADVAVGVGGYAPGPLSMMANMIGLPTLIQEQNSYAGKTNKSLARRAAKICVAYEGMDKFFPAEKVLLTGNPIRRESVDIAHKREAALVSFGLDPSKKTILVTGGSLGAGTLNDCIKNDIQKLQDADVQVIWQCGGYYFDKLNTVLGGSLPDTIKLMPFLQKMDYAYAAADLIIARAGAGTISELCVIGKPTILVPSPNVAEDHQTKNAMALVRKEATVMIKDVEAPAVLITTALDILKDEARCNALSVHIKSLGLLHADEVIAQEVLKLINK